MIKKLIVLVIILLTAYSYGDEDQRKVVIDLTTGDIDRLELYLLSGLSHNIEYYKKHLIDIDVVVIIHGNAYKFFIKDLSKTIYKKEKQLLKKQYQIYQRLKSLHDIYNVKFEICEAGLKSRNIPVDNIYDFVKPVYTVFVALVDYQNKGYAYFPIK